jgi:hypothetical protein
VAQGKGAIKSIEQLRPAFHAHLEVWRRRGYRPGTADCVHFTTEWIDSQCGTHYTEIVALEFRTRPLRDLCAFAKPGKLRGSVIQMLGAPLVDVPPKLGDVVMLQLPEDMPGDPVNSGKEMVGVAGEMMAYGPMLNGVGARPISIVNAVWPLERIT